MKLILHNPLVLLLLLCLTLCKRSHAQDRPQLNQKNSVYLSGQVKRISEQLVEPIKFDTLYIEIWDDHLSEFLSIVPFRSYAIPIADDGQWQTRIDSISKMTYFRLSPAKLFDRALSNHINSMDRMVMMPGDSIRVNNFRQKGADPWATTSGNSRQHYSSLIYIDRVTDAAIQLYQVKPFIHPKEQSLENMLAEINEVNERQDKILKLQLEALQEYAARLDSNMYKLFELNLRAESLVPKIDWLERNMTNPGIPTSTFNTVLSYHSLDIKSRITQLLSTYDDQTQVNSYALPKCISGYLLLRKRIERENFDPEKELMDFELEATMRERVLFAYLYQMHALLRTVNTELYIPLIQQIENVTYREILTGIYNSVRVGSEAYDFSLTDAYGNKVRLADFSGKAVFIDFWYTGCGGCAEYYKNVLKPVKEYFMDNDEVVFMTISIDPDPVKWKNSIKMGYYTSEDAVNLYTEGLAGRHPVIKHYGVNAYPRPLLVDKKSRIFNADKKDLRMGGPEKLISVIKECLKQD